MAASNEDIANAEWFKAMCKQFGVNHRAVKKLELSLDAHASSPYFRVEMIAQKVDGKDA